jgi:hypothetical protein
MMVVNLLDKFSLAPPRAGGRAVPRGVEHCPKALTDEVRVVLIEPKTTLNTGNVANERTLHALDRI